MQVARKMNLELRGMSGLEKYMWDILAYTIYIDGLRSWSR